VSLALTTFIISVLAWYSSARALLGDGFSSYVRETMFLSKRFAAGQSGFTFYWTVNALAVFGVICIACIIVGRGIAKVREGPITAGDLLLFCGLIYAVVAMKSGLNRCDLWHLNPPVLMLVFAFLLPSGRSVFTYSDRVGRLAVFLIAIMAATYLVGIAPTGSYYAKGLLKGMRDSITLKNSREIRTVKTRAPMIELERSHPSPSVLELGEYLATDSRAERPVLFYGDVWSLPKQIGVYKTDFINDDFLHSEGRGDKVRMFLQKRQHAIVIMSKHTYERLFGLSDPTQYPEFRKRYRPTITKTVASWLSTVHYKGVESEVAIKEQLWKRTVGWYVRLHYESVAEFGNRIVLMRKKTV